MMISLFELLSVFIVEYVIECLVVTVSVVIVDDRKVDIVEEASELRLGNDLLEDLRYMLWWIVESAAAESTENKCILPVVIGGLKGCSCLGWRSILLYKSVSCLAVGSDDGGWVLMCRNGDEVQPHWCHELVSSVLRPSEYSDAFREDCAESFVKRVSVFWMRCNTIFCSMSAELVKRTEVIGASEEIFLLSPRSTDDPAARCAVAGKIENAYLKVLSTHLKVSGEFKAVGTIYCNLCLAIPVICMHRCCRRVVEDCLCFDVRIEIEIDVFRIIIPASSLDSCYCVLVYLCKQRPCVLSSSEFWHYLDCLFPAAKPVCMVPIHIL